MRFLLLFFAIILPVQSTTAAEPVEGYWLTENRKAIIQTRICGAKICGHMVWLDNPLDANGQAKRGAGGAPLCGIQLIGDLKATGNGRWGKGWILDPRSGEKYSAGLRVVSSQKIKVRGYLGLPILGRSQTWTRVADDRGGC